MQDMATFALTLLHSGTNAHILHLQTDSFAKHEALGEYYEEIIELVDSLVETFQGTAGIITQYPNMYHPPKEPVAYLESLQKFVAESRDSLPQETEIQNIVDEIAQLIDSTVYKLRRFK
jgi:hypothetical protein